MQIGQKLVIPGKAAVARFSEPKVEAVADAGSISFASDATVAPVAPAAGESQIDFGSFDAPAETFTNTVTDPFSYTGKTVTIVERSQSLQDFADAVGVNAEVVRSLNPGLIGADDMIEENTVIAIPVY